MPLDIIPEDAGLIVADAYGAEMVREAVEKRLSPATRRAMFIRFGQAAADRLHRLGDPEFDPPIRMKWQLIRSRLQHATLTFQEKGPAELRSRRKRCFEEVHG